MNKKLNTVIKETNKVICEAHLNNQADQLEKVALRLRNTAEMLDFYTERDLLGAEELNRMIKRLEQSHRWLESIQGMLEGAKESLESFKDLV